MSRPPDALLVTIAERLAAGGDDRGHILDTRPVSGGCIHAGVRVEFAFGPAAFLKWSEGGPTDLFTREAEGLRALAEVSDGLFHVPKVLATDAGGSPEPDADARWLLLEWVEVAEREPKGAADLLGAAIVHLHKTVGTMGWPTDNYIGPLAQENTPSASWSEFWRDRRIVPQVAAARDSGWLGDRHTGVLDRLCDRMTILDGALENGAALLHGDLWGGNVLFGTDGRAVLIDPAVYRGHHEVDLAMAELFGFTAGFHESYRRLAPLAPDYYGYRRDLYQLYYLLVHVNLFGGSYVGGTLAAAQRVLSAVGG